VPKLSPLTPQKFANKRWKRFTSYGFAAGKVRVPIVHTELLRAITEIPVAFARKKDRFTLTAILGLEAGTNLYVARDGSWRGGYVPAALRSRPFHLGRDKQGNTLLCVDEESGLITEDKDAEPFYHKDGRLAERVKMTMSFLKTIEKKRAVTDKACEVLGSYGVIQPWNASREGLKLGGIYRADEISLHRLGKDALHNIKKAGGLRIAYAQIFSQQLLRVLTSLDQLKKKEKMLDPFQDTDSNDLEDMDIDWDSIKIY